jgi:DNA repair ATPase RecN
MIGVLSNVLLIAKAVPSRVKNVEQAQRELAELRQRRAELQAQLDALTARVNVTSAASVTSGEQAERSEQGEPMQAPAQGEIAEQSASVTSAASVTSGEQADHA